MTAPKTLKRPESPTSPHGKTISVSPAEPVEAGRDRAVGAKKRRVGLDAGEAADGDASPTTG
jgi:hypothetical protein